MSIRNHLYFFYLATTCWTLFFFGGLWSDYYQTWPWWLSLVLIVVFPTVALGALGYGLLNSQVRNGFVRAGLWLALYFTLPLFVYDYLYLGLHQQRGLSFLTTHWYLSVFYIIPWIVLPWAGAMIERKNPS